MSQSARRFRRSASSNWVNTEKRTNLELKTKTRHRIGGTVGPILSEAFAAYIYWRYIGISRELSNILQNSKLKGKWQLLKISYVRKLIRNITIVVVSIGGKMLRYKHVVTTKQFWIQTVISTFDFHKAFSFFFSFNCKLYYKKQMSIIFKR